MWVTGSSRCRVNQENPLMRIYIIGNDGITLCREAPATLNEGEIAVASGERPKYLPKIQVCDRLCAGGSRIRTIGSA